MGQIKFFSEIYYLGHGGCASLFFSEIVSCIDHVSLEQGLCKPRSIGQLPVFINKVFFKAQPHAFIYLMSMAAFTLQQQS